MSDQRVAGADAGSGLVGRDTERALLDRLLDAIDQGHSRALVIRGEPGVGKSELLGYLAGRAGGRTAVRVEGVEFESNLAYSALAQLVRPLRGHLGRLPARQRAALATATALTTSDPASNPAVPIAADPNAASDPASNPTVPTTADPNAASDPASTATDPTSATVPITATDPTTADAGGAAGSGSTDRLTVYMATLGLLSAAAAERGLVCLVDDAHWIDRASAEALLFAARRLQHDGVLIVFAARQAPAFAAPGLDELPLAGLPEAAGMALVARHASVPPAVAAQLVAATGGNPLALTELPRLIGTGAWPAPLTAGAPVPMTDRLERAFAAELSTLERPTRAALLICAVGAVGAGDDLTLIGAALNVQGIDLAALDPAVERRLLRLRGDQVTFRHPLVRSAVYGEAGPGARRDAHRCLAEVLVDPQDADRRAWHLAHAAWGPDPAAADALAETAGRARRRGGVTAEAMAFERAAALTVDRVRRGTRLIAAASAWSNAGLIDHAYDLLCQARPLLAGAPERLTLVSSMSYLALLRGDYRQMAAEITTEVEHGTAQERAAAARMLSISMNAPLSRWDVAATLAVCEQVVRLMGEDRSFPKAAIRLAHARVLAGRADGVELAETLISGCTGRAADGGAAELGEVLTWVERYAEARELLEHDVLGARAVNDVSLLAYAQSRLARLHLRRGELRAAHTAAVESLRAAQTMGQPVNTAHVLATLSNVESATGSWQGCQEHASAVLTVAEETSDLALETAARAALGTAALCRGHYPQAVTELGRVVEALRAGAVVEPGVLPVAGDLAEAYLRVGRPDLAARTLAHLRATARSTRRAGQLAVAARVEALLATGAGAEQRFTAALSRFETVDAPLELARTRLVFGQWLRRAKRRRDARAHLTAAQAAFDAAGAAGWARRAEEELAACGARRPAAGSGPDGGPGGPDGLTPQERHILRAAREGLSSREIAARSMLSTKTVDHHLGSIYRKLGIRSRRELMLLPDGGVPPRGSARSLP